MIKDTHGLCVLLPNLVEAAALLTTYMSFWSKYKARSWPYTGGVAIPPGAYRDQKRRKTSLPNTLSEKEKNQM